MFPSAYLIQLVSDALSSYFLKVLHFAKTSESSTMFQCCFCSFLGTAVYLEVLVTPGCLGGPGPSLPSFSVRSGRPLTCPGCSGQQSAPGGCILTFPLSNCNTVQRKHQCLKKCVTPPFALPHATHNNIFS